MSTATAEVRTPWIKDRSATPDPARVMDFYVGSHMPRWMEESPVPLFISQRTLNKYRRDGDPFPKSRCLVAIDSGGFTELQQFGEWTMDADDLRRDDLPLHGQRRDPAVRRPAGLDV